MILPICRNVASVICVYVYYLRTEGEFEYKFDYLVILGDKSCLMGECLDLEALVADFKFYFTLLLIKA